MDLGYYILRGQIDRFDIKRCSEAFNVDYLLLHNICVTNICQVSVKLLFVTMLIYIVNSR